jgi:hypothetical protein
VTSSKGSVRRRARFWDTSAIIQVYHAYARDHRRALGLWSGPRSRSVEHVTSALVAVEAVRRIHVVEPEFVADVRDALTRMWRVPVDDQILPIGYMLASKGGQASGADRAIVACAIWTARQVNDRVEFITSDRSQAEIAENSSSNELDVIRLQPGV